MSLETEAGHGERDTAQVKLPQIDVGTSVWQNHHATLSVEPPKTDAQIAADIKSKHRQEIVAQGMNVVLFIAALAAVGTVFVMAVEVLHTGTAEEKKLAIPLLTLITSGLVGFLVGKATAK
jgi:hypothetical protein